MFSYTIVALCAFVRTIFFNVYSMLTLMFFRYPVSRPCPPSPLRPVLGHVLGNTHARHVFLYLMVPCLLGTSSSSGTLYRQVHHSAGDVVCISSMDMSKPKQ